MKKTSFFGKTTSSQSLVVTKYEGYNLALWVEEVQVASDRTIVHLACQGRDGKAGWLTPSSYIYNFAWNGQTYNWTPELKYLPYLVDDSGQPYNVSADSGVYDSVYTFDRRFWERESFLPAHYVRVDEIYRFYLAFPPLQQGVSQLRLHLDDFEPSLELDSAVAKAERIPPIPPPQLPSPVVATSALSVPTVPTWPAPADVSALPAEAPRTGAGLTAREMELRSDDDQPSAGDLVTSSSPVVAAPALLVRAIPAPPDVAAPPVDATRTSSGLATKVMKPGSSNAHPSPGDLVTVHYTGWTTDGRVFDSSVARGRPETFIVGNDPPLLAFSEGVRLMVPGEIRRLWIPESLAYTGPRPVGMIVPKGMLVIDMQLIADLGLGRNVNSSR